MAESAVRCSLADEGTVLAWRRPAIGLMAVALATPHPLRVAVLVCLAVAAVDVLTPVAG